MRDLDYQADRVLILVEGCDKTGKSTLIEALALQLGAEVIHRSRPEKHPLLEYEADLDDYRPGTGRHVICDRWHFGELVWPTIYGRKSEYTPEAFLHTELFLQSRGALMVLGTSTEEAIISRLYDAYPPPEKVGEALHRFAEIASTTRLPLVEYDFTKVALLSAVRQLTKVAQELEGRAATRYTVTPHWVGALQPDLLLVGDRPGRNDRGPAVPAVPFRPFGGASVYLMRALECVDRVAVTNTFDGTAPVDLRALWNSLLWPRVVALGDVACKAVGEAGVPHGVVPHPQWVRRFHHRKMMDYPALLKRAAQGEDTRKETRQWTSSPGTVERPSSGRRRPYSETVRRSGRGG